MSSLPGADPTPLCPGATNMSHGGGGVGSKNTWRIIEQKPEEAVASCALVPSLMLCTLVVRRRRRRKMWEAICCDLMLFQA